MKMPIIAFDTLKFSKKFENSGLTTQQEEVFSHATSEAISSFLEDQIATKSDILGLKKEHLTSKNTITDLRKITEALKKDFDQ